MATAMANVALFEHCTISSSSWIIFFIRDTKSVNNSHVVAWYVLGSAVWPVISSAGCSGVSLEDMVGRTAREM